MPISDFVISFYIAPQPTKPRGLREKEPVLTTHNRIKILTNPIKISRNVTAKATALLAVLLIITVAVAIYPRSASAANTWTTQTVVEDNGGWDSSIALDSAQNPCLTYFDGLGKVMYAHYDGSAWHTEVVDTVSTSYAGTPLPSLAFNPAGYPCISYEDITAHQLKYASYNGLTWQITVADAYVHAGNGEYSCLAFNSAGQPCISYHGYSDDGLQVGLKYAYFDGSAWQKTLITTAGCLHTSLTINSLGRPCIAYQTNDMHLSYAYYDGASWHDEAVDTSTYTGGWCEVRINGAGNPCIGYTDEYNYDIKFATKVGATWQISTVDSSGKLYHNALAINDVGNPCMSYYDYDSLSVKYACYDGSSWQKETVGAGMPSSLVFNSDGRVYISYNVAGSDLMVASAPAKVSVVFTVTMNSAATRSITITGGNPNASTFQADGLPHTITFDKDASYTLSFDSLTNVRDGFKEGVNTFSATYSGTSVSGSVSITAYEQVYNTFSAAGLSGTDQVTLTGTTLGTSSTELGVLSSSNSWQSSFWSDYNAAVTFPGNSANSVSTERWSLQNELPYTTSTLIAGGGSYSQTYYHQYNLILGYNVIGGSTSGGYSIDNPTVHYTQFGSVLTATALTSGGPSVWVDALSDVVYSNPLTIGRFPTERWQINLPITGGLSTVETSVSDSKTLNPTYYHQGWDGVYTGGLSGSDYVEVSGTYFGTFYPVLDILNDSNSFTLHRWYDCGTLITIPFSSAASTANERWEYMYEQYSDSNTLIASGHCSLIGEYIHQYRNLYTITGLSDANTGTITVVNTPNNILDPSMSVTLSSSNGWSAYVWSDADTSATFSASSADSANERWVNNQATTDPITSGGNTYTRQYIHQYKVALNYNVIGGGSPTAPILTATQGGSAYTPTLDTSGSSYWLDAGTDWSITNPLDGSDNTQRWFTTQTASGTVSATSPVVVGETGTFSYNNQYALTLVSDHGAPTGAGWYNPGDSASFGVTSPDGTIGTRYVFTGWSSSDSDGYTGSTAQQTITMNGPVTETASWKTQYQVTYAITSTGSGTTTPDGTNIWTDSGALAITAAHNPGYTFASWSTSDSITFDNATAVSTTAIISGPGTITATFTQNPVTHFDFNVVGVQTAGTSFTITVTAKDAFGNTIPWYTGTVHFSSNDSSAVLPADYTFQAQDQGIKTFTVTLKTAGTNTITVAEATNSQVNGNSGNIAVTHAATVSSIAITPATSAITAGTTKTFTATATDPYGNTWDITPTTTWSINGTAHGNWSSNIYTSETAGTWTVRGTLGSNTATVTLTVNPATVDHFTISTPDSITVRIPFDITVTALDAYGNKATGFNGVVTLTSSIGAIYPSPSGTFTAGIWTGPVASTSWGSVSITVSDSNGHTAIKAVTVQGPSSSSSSTSTPSASTSPEPTPTPTSNQNVIHAATTSGTVDIPITGNITATQVTSATLTATADKTVLSFTLTGQSGTTGFSNMTIPKSAVPSGTAPIIYIDGSPAENQGYTEDANNYYVWYTTHFSSHNITVEFGNQQQPSTSPTPTDQPTEVSLWVYIAFIASIALVTAVSIMLGYKKIKSH